MKTVWFNDCDKVPYKQNSYAKEYVLASEAAERERVLVSALEQVRHWIMGGIWCFDKSPDEFIRAALAAKEE